MRDDGLGRALVAIARRAIGAEFGAPDGFGTDSSWREHEANPALGAPGATFVTLFSHGTLRGCIGTLEARRVLGADVRANAVAAAFADPRFPHLGADEFLDTLVEVSLLSATEAVTADSERALLDRLRPGVDGVVLEYAGRRATFLPQVWESLPEPADFLAELKRKAALPIDFWSSAVKVSRYDVIKWRESDLRGDVHIMEATS
jgi:AmmeMemoRadiSam system protein A